ncbi:hypothetical protein [Lacihabitans soyangensis]|uniref:Uncharacterized protein n=1 Tax=Lacihabitans soyangensis TaxID=869394 RepID=A0AAE3KRM0_9BACT|nr:hypothetical protein [Lacihabitans soyangensis]MCP9762352.1 hypothetical protein [Lacihabitans soyangensis]
MNYKQAFTSNYKKIFVGIIILAFAVLFYSNNFEEKESLNKVVDWPEITTANNLKCNLKTKYFEGRIYNQLNLSINDSSKESRRIKGCTLKFLDQENFLIREFDYSELTNLVDENGIIVGYEINESFEISKEEYKSYSNYSVAVLER